MLSRREEVFESLRLWRIAERELTEETDGRRAELEEMVVRRRDEYHGFFTDLMVEQLAELHEVDQQRFRSTPSTPEYHDAMRRTEAIAADIWELARRGDREAPPTRV